MSSTTGTFVKRHRLNQNISQNELSSAASISRFTLSLFERGEAVTLATSLRVLRVLELLYVLDAFKPVTHISPMQLAKVERQQRRRASNKKITLKQTVTSSDDNSIRLNLGSISWSHYLGSRPTIGIV